MNTAALAILVAIASIVSAALIAGIGAVWRLGSRMAEFKLNLVVLAEECRLDRQEHADLGTRIDGLVEHVGEVDGRLQAVEARCQERREQSGRFKVPPNDDSGTPTPIGGCR
jgi:hypothetical protein